MQLRRLVVIGALVAVLVAAFGACGGDDGGGSNGPTVDADATVQLKATTFAPEDVSIKVGDTVLWKWGGGVQHNVHATKGADFKSKLQSSGQFTHTFDAAGEVTVVCDVHPTTMKGTFTVTE